MDRSIQAGVSGFVLAVIISLFLPIPYDILAFIPSFVAAIIVIYMFRLAALKDGFVAAFMTYFFSQGILTAIGLAVYYAANETYELTPDIGTVFSPAVTLISAVIAGYLGVALVQRMKPTREQPPSMPPPLPPV